MYHSTLRQMQDEMIEHPGRMFITSHSRRSAILSSPTGGMLFIEGDFSGTPEENEAEARRILGVAHIHRTVIAE